MNDNLSSAQFERDDNLDRLAHGVDCPRCGAWSDTPCKTRRAGTETKPHIERIDKAVRLHQKAQG